MSAPKPPALPNPKQTLMGLAGPKPQADKAADIASKETVGLDAGAPPSRRGADLSGDATLAALTMDRAPGSAPPADGLDRDLALARMQQRLLARPADPVKIGRFVVVKKLGQGAMGIVYLAYDPKLDRKVALKLVDRSAFGSEVGDAQARLEREAQAAATLSHPNVVTVYDVGRHEDGVFLAMEYVEGSSLGEWLEAEPRSWRDIVQMFIEIGRGLAEAHKAGLVHRDFKPDNVLVGSDGRPRVADFGLAMPTEGWTAREASRVLTDGRRKSLHLTGNEMADTGEVCGTPAYMAPEQFAGVGVTAASDQFGFCSALYEALFRGRAFAGESVTDIAVAVIDNNREPLPKKHSVPGEVVSVTVMGLEPTPDGRHPSMDVVVDRLAAVLPRRRRRMIGAAAALLAAAGIAGGYQVSQAAVVDPCEGEDQKIAAVWNESAAEEIRAAAPSGLAESTNQFIAGLDQYTSDWSKKRREVCEATRVSGQQSERDLQLRNACLGRATSRIEGIRTALSDGVDSGELDLASAVLLPLDQCDNVFDLERDERALRTRHGGSMDATAAFDRAERLHTRLMLMTEQPPEQWVPLAEELRELGEQHQIPRSLALGLHFLGAAAEQHGDLEQAAEHYRLAVQHAVLGSDDQLSTLMERQAKVALARGLFVEARLHAENALAFAQRERTEGRGTQLELLAEAMLADVDVASGEFAAARERAESLQAREDLDAAHDGDLLRARINTVHGQSCKNMGDLPCAAEHMGNALDLLTASGDAAPIDLAGRHGDIAIVHARMGNGKDAVEHIKTAIDLVEANYGEEHPMLVKLWSDLGGIQAEQLDPKEGRENLEHGLALGEKLFGKDAPQLVATLNDLVRLDERDGDLIAAREKAERALRIREAGVPEGDPRRAIPRILLGRVLLNSGEPSQARDVLAEAMAITDRDDVDPMLRADVAFNLAQATLYIRPSEARQIANAALAQLPPEDHFNGIRGAIEGWLAGPAAE